MCNKVDLELKKSCRTAKSAAILHIRHDGYSFDKHFKRLMLQEARWKGDTRCLIKPKVIKLQEHGHILQTTYCKHLKKWCWRSAQRLNLDLPAQPIPCLKQGTTDFLRYDTDYYSRAKIMWSAHLISQLYMKYIQVYLSLLKMVYSHGGSNISVR